MAKFLGSTKSRIIVFQSPRGVNVICLLIQDSYCWRVGRSLKHSDDSLIDPLSGHRLSLAKIHIVGLRLLQSMLLRMPPRIKVLEAASSVADGRVKKQGDSYRVVSSSGEVRVYTVSITDSKVKSDDNGTVYRGYVGYPIIAVLMVEGRLQYNPRIGEALRGIPWKKLNDQYKNYAAVEQIANRKASEAGITSDEIDKYVDLVLMELKSLKLERA